MSRKSVLAAAAGLAAAISIVGTAGSAGAAAQAPTLLYLSPHAQNVTYAARQITYQGTLAGMVSGQYQGLPGEQVTLLLLFDNEEGSVTLGSATTGAAGQFSIPVTVPEPGFVLAQFAGDSNYKASTSPVSVVNRDPAAAPMPARIVVNPIAPAPVYSTVTVTGQVQMELSGGTWVPEPYAPVTGASPAYADADGNFAVPVYEDPAVYQHIQSKEQYPGETWAGDATSADLVMPLSVYPTAVSDFQATRTSLPDLAFVAYTGYGGPLGQWVPLPGLAVQLSYQPHGSGQWIPVAQATGDDFGKVTISHVSGFLPGGQLATGAGTWQLSVLATATNLASASGAVSVRVTVPVWVNGVRFRHPGGRTYLTGVLDEHPHSGPVSGQLVSLYRSGHRVATLRTGGNGVFSFRMTGRPFGSYQIRYSGGALPGGGGRYVPASGAARIAVTYRR